MKKNCPICNHNKSKIVILLNQSNYKNFINLSKKYKGYLEEITPDFSKVKILRCNNCSHHWYAWKPKDEEIIKMYDKHLKKRKKPNNTLEIKKSKYIQKELLSLKFFIRKIYPTFLDYGSGLGFWARVAKDLNYIVFAYEPSLNRIEDSKGNNYKDINLIKNLKEISKKQIDIINLEQVLEHIPNPLEVLKDLETLCNTRTIVRVTVPNLSKCKEGKSLYSSWPFTGKSKHTLSPYEHLNGFTQSSLRITYSKAGFIPAYKFMLLHKPIMFIRLILGEYIKQLATTSIYLIKN